MRISITDVTFHQHVDPKPGGSVFLGYIQKGKLNFHDSNGQTTCSMDLKLEVRKNREGKLSLAGPRLDTWTNRQGETVYPRAFRFDDATYTAILKAVAQLPQVIQAWQAAEGRVYQAPAQAVASVEQLSALTGGNANALQQLLQAVANAQSAAPAPAPVATAVGAAGSIDVG